MTHLDRYHHTLLTLVILTTISSNIVQADEQIDSQPADNGHRGRKPLMLENAEGAVITLWKPDLTTEVLQPAHSAVTIPPTGMDNYHALVAEKDWGDIKEALIRYEYLFGRPSKHSPNELAGAIKTELEIVPAPIPREHFRYYSDQSWGFQVRLHGQPLADLPLTLETEHGSRLEVTSDSSGYARFRLPDDFPGVQSGERDRRSAEFAVIAATEQDGVVYETRLTAAYQVNPSHWQSNSLGWAAIGLGFLVGGLISRQKEQRDKTA
jgi:hypothetical protein